MQRNVFKVRKALRNPRGSEKWQTFSGETCETLFAICNFVWSVFLNGKNYVSYTNPCVVSWGAKKAEGIINLHLFILCTEKFPTLLGGVYILYETYQPYLQAKSPC